MSNPSQQELAQARAQIEAIAHRAKSDPAYMQQLKDNPAGTLLASIGLLPSLFSPVAAILQVLESVPSAAGSVERVAELLEEPITVADTPDAVALPPLAQEIRLEHVSFSYGADRPILQDFNLTIPAGTQFAVVGPSGSGKSTLVNLLLRFWDPEGGGVSSSMNMICGQ